MKNIFFYLIIIFNIIIKPILANADFEMGLDAFNKKNYNLAYENWLKSLEANDHRSKFYIALLYKDGLGVGQNYKKALDYFLKASNQGILESHYYIALFYFNGLGVDKDHKIADIKRDAEILEATDWECKRIAVFNS